MQVSTRVKVRISKPTMTAVVGDITRAGAERAAGVTAKRYRDNIKRSDRIDTGRMRNEVRVEPMRGRPALYPGYRIGTPAPYAKFQEFGTRAHGPVRAKALRFKPKGSAVFVFAKWVRGVRPAHFARNALDRLRPRDFEV